LNRNGLTKKIGGFKWNKENQNWEEKGSEFSDWLKNI